MRIQRYIAKDMRSALAQVREALGPDAVILSSGKIGDEVEVVAAIDMEVARAVRTRAAGAARVHARDRGRPTHGARAVRPRESRHGELLTAPRRRRRFPKRGADRRRRRPRPPSARRRTAAPRAAGQEALASEMKDMRRMLESQLATLAWNDMTRRSPIQAAMLKELAQLGITQDLSNSLVRKIPAVSISRPRGASRSRPSPATIQTTGDRWLERGGIVAFAGPAGAGKTTLLAKLAARWVLRHGPRSVAIISADSVRIGAHEQMHMLGRLLGVTTTTSTTWPSCPSCCTSCATASSS
jgi:flagellar biosynthesis protein FlhF